jgi:hypothetical protein
VNGFIIYCEIKMVLRKKLTTSENSNLFPPCTTTLFTLDILFSIFLIQVLIFIPESRHFVRKFSNMGAIEQLMEMGFAKEKA